MTWKKQFEEILYESIGILKNGKVERTLESKLFVDYNNLEQFIQDLLDKQRKEIRWKLDIPLNNLAMIAEDGYAEAIKDVLRYLDE